MKKLFIYIFTACLIAGGISVFAGADRSFSENENRYLTKLSDVLSADILSGEFQQQLSNGLRAQIGAVLCGGFILCVFHFLNLHTKKHATEKLDLHLSVTCFQY